ncbi:DUF4825 domain-containing protein [uncultured Oscillibacter sp.]|uniref:DUF4825 domain-containing protein n=1 Tax=uncultured Oscillibacter sp. TaxID=876091 RepID=UPI0025EA44BB|nr:DUF4825 domain-containing protein [uncultured Oscillibacter sp.]
MKNDLSCGVVRDLLPSYVENLLGEESREAVDRHLAGCPECTARKEAMTAPAGQAEETAKEVDFLKGVKKRSGKRVALAVLCTVVVLVGAFLVKEFVIGRAVDPESISIQCAEVDEQGSLTFLADTYWGAYELRGLRSTEEDGIIRYTAREVRMNAFQFMGEEAYRKQIPLTVSLKNVTEVWFCGRLVWQEGLIIHPDTLRMLETKTPYCGDPAALGRIMDALRLQEFTGGHTVSLQTRERPYVLTLKFEKRISPFIIWDWTECYFFQILVLVDNLDEVVYAFDPERDSGKTVTGGRVTVEYATEVMAKLTESHNLRYGTDWPIHENFKEYAESPLEYQRMITLLEESCSYKQGYPLIWSDSSGRS